jgi:hypothetical protein
MSTNSPIRILKRFTTPLKPVLLGGEELYGLPEQISLEVEYDQSGKVAREIKFDQYGEEEEIHSYRYDERGHLVEHLMELPQDGIMEKFVTELNPDGNPVSIVKYYGEDPGERTEYRYGSHAHPVVIHRADADGEFDSSDELIYDETPRLIIRKYKSAYEGEKEFRFSYNESGFLAEEQELDQLGSVFSTLQYEYREDGQEAVVVKKNASGKTESTQVNEFDDLGRLVRRVSKGFYIRISGFVYDDLGRLTEETLSDENGFVISRKHTVFGDHGRVVHETVYETDLTRTGRDSHLAHRFEYEDFSAD